MCFLCFLLKSITAFNWAPSSEFVSSSIPSWQILTAHAQPFRGARDLAFCLKVPLDSLLVWASSGGSCETARMRRLAWTFAARIGDKYQIRLTRSNCELKTVFMYLVISFLVLRAGCGIWLYQFLIIAYRFTLQWPECTTVVKICRNTPFVFNYFSRQINIFYNSVGDADFWVKKPQDNIWRPTPRICFQPDLNFLLDAISQCFN